MMNEIGVGTDVSAFNINDYIWYIVGGIALFFVIVGFIADKSGLAKKTFSKDSKKETMKEAESEQNSITENNAVDSFNETETLETPQMGMEDNLSYENTDEENEIIGETGPLYISEEPEVATDAFISVEQDVNNFDTELDTIENQSVDEISMVNEDSNVQSDVADIWVSDENEQDIVIDSLEDNEEVGEIPMVTSENNEEDRTTDISDIAAEDAETEWGVDSNLSDNEASGLTDVELPDLEDIDINTEEEVWKF